MYLTAQLVLDAINRLKEDRVHPFVGITFIACKRFGLPVGRTEPVSLDTITRDHLTAFHIIDRRSAWYFQPFMGGARTQWWVDRRYPSTGLQTANTQTFPSVFLHKSNTRRWGFADNYLANILEILRGQRRPAYVPADALAVWLFKDEDVGGIETLEELVQLFFRTYSISYEEQQSLFSGRALTKSANAFSPEPLSMNDVARAFPPPPDAEAETGKTLVSLRLTNVGPSRQMRLDFGERLSLITGDNGLGKSFLLDFAWWAATGEWADRELLPTTPVGKRPLLEYDLQAMSGSLSTYTATFNMRSNAWSRPSSAMTVEALAVFSRADGSFAVSDPLRRAHLHGRSQLGSLSSRELWDGRLGTIEGLIRDWARWQSSPDRKTFDRFAAVLKRLSPEDLGTLVPGPTTRIGDDPREIPTIQHKYGSVPVTQASSGVQRVLLLAYLIIWCWQEHELRSERTSSPVLRRMLVLVDELEAHLHPKWQRIVLPALMSVGDLLSSELVIQMVAATHSPMILASLESIFDAESDVLYHLYGDGPVVKLEEFPFVKYGDASGWLTSPLFGLRHARSKEAERAIEDAKALQLVDNVDKAEVTEVSERLKRHLAAEDKFWPRWIYFAELNGVNL